MSAALATVPISNVKASGDNPRRDLGDLEGLAASITAVGILEPLLVTRSDEGYRLVAGARRLAAAKAAGLAEVPCVVTELDEDARAEAMLIENLQREDLAPLEEAEAYRRLLERPKVTQRTLAARIGRSQSHISKRLALLSLPKPAREALDSGGITIEDAAELGKLASHPKRVKAVLEHRNRYETVAEAVRRHTGEIAGERKLARRRSELEAEGVAAHTRLPKGVPSRERFEERGLA